MRARRRPAIVILLAISTVLASCTSNNEPATTVPATTSTTQIILDLEPATGASVVLGDGVDGGRTDVLTEWVADLRGAAELVRGLRFLDEPEILFLAMDEFREVWERRQQPALDPTALAVDTRFLQLLGVLNAGQSLRVMLTPVFDAAPTAFFDAERSQIVIAAPDDDVVGRDVERDVVAAVVVALTDQYHQHAARAVSLRNDGRLDEADALAALVAADAAYFSLVYLQEIDVADSVPVTAATPGGGLPAPLASALAFPFEEGLAFVAQIVGSSGIAGIDEVYGMDRLTTEQLLHPERFGAPDPVPDVGPTPLALTGYRLHRTGTVGELALRSLLGHAQRPGIARQAITGWGGDHFALFASGNEVAWVYMYRGDSVDDTVEVAQAFLDLAETAMGLNEPIAVGGGVEFLGRLIEAGAAPETVTGPYVFVDRVGDGLLVVIASEIDAGRRLVASTEVP